MNAAALAWLSAVMSDASLPATALRLAYRWALAGSPAGLPLADVDERSQQRARARLVSAGLLVRLGSGLYAFRSPPVVAPAEMPPFPPAAGGKNAAFPPAAGGKNAAFHPSVAQGGEGGGSVSVPGARAALSNGNAIFSGNAISAPVVGALLRAPVDGARADAPPAACGPACASACEAVAPSDLLLQPYCPVLERWVRAWGDWSRAGLLGRLRPIPWPATPDVTRAWARARNDGGPDLQAALLDPAGPDRVRECLSAHGIPGPWFSLPALFSQTGDRAGWRLLYLLDGVYRDVRRRDSSSGLCPPARSAVDGPGYVSNRARFSAGT